MKAEAVRTAYDDQFSASHTAAQFTRLLFRDSEQVAFSMTNEGMEASVRTTPLPPFAATPFNEEFDAYLANHQLADPLTRHLLQQAIRAALHRSLALHALLGTLETNGGDDAPST